MVPFCLKSYNIVAPYENLDDDYASKIGKSAVASIPDGAFDYPFLKDFKKSCNETKDSVGKLCSITLDRGPMGFVECIGQGMEDAVQTDKGIAAIFGSVSGMTLGAFAGGKFVKSFSTPKAKFKEGRYEHHMSYVEKFTEQGGAS